MYRMRILGALLLLVLLSVMLVSCITEETRGGETSGALGDEGTTTPSHNSGAEPDPEPGDDSTESTSESVTPSPKPNFPLPETEPSEFPNPPEPEGTKRY